MGFFNGVDHKYVINWHFHKQSLANGMWQMSWDGISFFKFICIINEFKY